MPQILADDLREALAVLTKRDHAREVVVYAAGKDRTEDDPEVDTRSPERTRKCAEDRAKPCDVEQLDEKHLPRRQGDVVHSILEPYRRSNLPRTPKRSVYDCTIYNVAHNERCERTKKCNHSLSLLSLVHTKITCRKCRPPVPYPPFIMKDKRSSPK